MIASARIVRYVAEGFGGLELDVDWSLSGSGDVGPGQVMRSAGPGATLDFSFLGTPLAPPDSGRFLVISVNAPGYLLNGTATVHAEEYPGGPVFSVQVSNLAVPVPLGPGGLRILSIERRVEGRIIIHFVGALNRWHEVQRSSDCINWTTFRNIPVLESPSIDAFNPAGSPDEEYYRIVLP